MRPEEAKLSFYVKIIGHLLWQSKKAIIKKKIGTVKKSIIE